MPEVKNTRVAGFEISLQNSENPDDTTKRTISFDVSSNVDFPQVETVASALFANASLSNVFQPTNWRDYEGNFEVYLMTGVTPVLTEKVVTTGDMVIPS